MKNIGIKWKKVWEQKAKDVSSDITLSNLISIDGFDTGIGVFPIESWLKFIEKIASRLELKRGNKILEVGCGAGAFLFPLYNRGVEVYGIDYSVNQIALCKKIMDRGVFKVGEANRLPFESEFFDVAISNSVFQYFSDLEYAEKVVTEMARVLKRNGYIGIFDVNDLEKKEEFIAARKRKLGEKKYERLYGNLEQLFYSKEWFREIAKQYGFDCTIEDQYIEGYFNSGFRYNVFFKKRF